MPRRGRAGQDDTGLPRPQACRRARPRTRGGSLARARPAFGNKEPGQYQDQDGGAEAAAERAWCERRAQIPPADDQRGRHGHAARRNLHRDSQALVRPEGSLAERCDPPGSGCPGAGRGAACGARVTEGAGDVCGRGDPRRDAADGHRPGIADEVPGELVVATGRAEGASHLIADHVGVRPGDRPVRVPDPDMRHAAAAGDARRRRRAVRAGHADAADRELPVVLGIDGLEIGDVAEDAVPLIGPEVVGDGLLDSHHAVALDYHPHHIGRDPLGTGLRGCGRG